MSIRHVAIFRWLLCGFLCLPFWLSAQSQCSHQLKLKVLSKEQGAEVPVIGASVGLGNLQSLTDLNGLVIFDAVCPGKIHLHIHALGYQPVEIDLPFKSGKDTLQIVIKTIGVTLDNIEIKGHRQALQTANSSASLYRDDLDRHRGQNLATSLEAITGVRNLQTGSGIGKPVIQGMHSNRVLILNNGLRQEGQQWGAEHAPELDPFVAQTITVVKGAEGVRYGSDAIGGVVLLEPAPIPTDSALHATLDLIGMSNSRAGIVSASLSGHHSKVPELTWRTQGTLKKAGNYHTAQYFLENTGLQEQNYSAALAYTRKHLGMDLFYSHFQTTIGLYRGSHIGSMDDLLSHIERGRPLEKGSFSYSIASPRQQVSHDLLKLNTHLHLSDYWHLSLQYGWQKNVRQEFDIRRAARESLPNQHQQLHTHSIDLNSIYFDGSKWKGIVGINGLYQNNQNISGTLTTPLIPDYISNSWGVYAIGRRMVQRLELEAGIRYDLKAIHSLGYDKRGNLYGSQRWFQTFTGSLGAVFRPHQLWELRSNMGTAWRAPSVNELYSKGIHQSAGAYELGDSSLQAEKSVKWASSLRFTNVDSWLELELDLFAQYLLNYIYLNPSGDFYESLSGSFPIFRQTQTNAGFIGADINATFHFSAQWQFTLKGSALRARDLVRQAYLPLIPADKLEQQLSWKPPSFSVFKQPYIQLNYVWVGKQHRYTPGSDFAPAPTAYHLFNLDMGTQLKAGKHTLGVHFSVENLSNTLYKDYLNRIRYFAHNRGRNFVLRFNYRI